MPRVAPRLRRPRAFRRRRFRVRAQCTSRECLPRGGGRPAAAEVAVATRDDAPATWRRRATRSSGRRRRAIRLTAEIGLSTPASDGLARRRHPARTARPPRRALLRCCAAADAGGGMAPDRCPPKSASRADAAHPGTSHAIERARARTARKERRGRREPQHFSGSRSSSGDSRRSPGRQPSACVVGTRASRTTVDELAHSVRSNGAPIVTPSCLRIVPRSMGARAHASSAWRSPCLCWRDVGAFRSRLARRAKVSARRHDRHRRSTSPPAKPSTYFRIEQTLATIAATSRLGLVLFSDVAYEAFLRGPQPLS